MVIWTELVYAARSLRRTGALTVTAVATLAVSLGVAIAVAGIIDQSLLRPFPAAAPGDLLSVYQHQTASGTDHTGVPPADYLDIEQAVSGTADVAFYIHRSLDDPIPLTYNGVNELVGGLRCRRTSSRCSGAGCSLARRQLPTMHRR